MRKADLSAPRAKLDWANNQLAILNAEIRLFSERKPYRIVTKPNPEGPGVLMYLESSEPVPQMIAMHIGSILAAQRDSLDFLITTLAEKNGAVEPRDCYFPIADSAQRFLEKGTQKKIKWLSPEERAIIHDLKPYKGGNNKLYAFNWLCQKGKHRKPILIGSATTGFGVGGDGYIRSIALFGYQEANSGAPLAAVDASPGIKLDFTMQIAFREASDAAPRSPVIPTLREFSRMAASIIDLFA